MKACCNKCKREHVISFLQDSFTDVKAYNLKCEVFLCDGNVEFTATQEVAGIEPVKCINVGTGSGIFNRISDAEIVAAVPCHRLLK